MIMISKRYLIKVLFLILIFSYVTGCKRYDFSVSQQIINRNYLASTHVNTPDPKQESPPNGKRLIMSWHIPKDIFERKHFIELDIIYWDYTEGHFTYPIESQKGYVLYSLLNEEFEKKKGLLSYKARIVTSDGFEYRNWKQQLWVDLIHVDEESYEPIPAPQFPE